MQDHVAGEFKAFQSYQGAHHLHAIVCGAVEAVGKLAFFAAELKDDAISTGPAWVSETRAITENFDRLKAGIKFDNWRFEVFAGVFLILVLLTAGCRFSSGVCACRHL